MRVLLVEADPAVAARIADGLSREGIRVDTVASAGEVPSAPSVDHPVVLVGLADGDRLGLCRALRASDRAVRIVMLTPRREGTQVIDALEAGADDALARDGLSVRELAGRLRAVARRPAAPPPPAGPQRLVAGPVAVDRERGRVEVAGEVVQLGPVELGVLAELMSRAGRVLARPELVRRVWGRDPVDERTVDTVVRRLRARLGAAGALIETVRGVGYRFGAPPADGT